MDTNITNYNWNWTEFCGADSLQIWTKDMKDLSNCFQFLCLHIPILSLFAIVSAYHAGKQGVLYYRSTRERIILNLRLIMAIILALLPIIELTISLYRNKADVFVINYAFSMIGSFSWLIHLAYITCLKSKRINALRGPVILNSLWIMYYIVCIIHTRSLYLLYMANNTQDYLISLIFSVVATCSQTLYGISLLPSEDPVNDLQRTDQDGENFSYSYIRLDDTYSSHFIGAAMEDNGVFSRIFFMWVNKLMKQGAKNRLKGPDDVFCLPISLNANMLNFDLRTECEGVVPVSETEYRCGIKMSLLKVLHKLFALEFYAIGVLKFMGDVIGFASPLLLHKLLEFIDSTDIPTSYGYLYGGGIFLSTFLSSLLGVHFSFLIGKLKLKIRGTLIPMIYGKVLRLHGSNFKKISMGEIINHMSVDIDRISDSCNSIHIAWSVPLQLGITIYLLYEEVGPVFLIGVFATLILIPVNRYIAKKIGEFSVQLMRNKDERVGLMSELIRGMKVIKLHVWEKFFLAKIGIVRLEEMKYLKYRKYLDAICVYFWATTPVMMSTMTFSFYIYGGNQLNASIVFTTLTLLNMLVCPLNAFPWILNGVVEAWVSLKRVDSFLKCDEILKKFDCSTINSCNPEMGDIAIYIRDGSFSWNNEENQLLNINVRIKKGELVGVVGPVGSGKSTLIHSILGEIRKTNGQFFLNDAYMKDGFGFVPQTPWIQQCSVRENILFGKPYDEDFYAVVINACALEDDFKLWPSGDRQLVGDSGSTLSGGQKARIALARAIYQDKNIYLFDDVFSAVDRKVAHHIYQECVLKLLAGKTRILVTHMEEFFSSFDVKITMLDGKAEQRTLKTKEANVSQSPILPIIEAYEEEENDENKTEIVQSNAHEKELDKEIKAEGAVVFRVYSKYFSSVGQFLTLIVILSAISMQVSRVSVDWWLSVWVTKNKGIHNNTGWSDRLMNFEIDILGHNDVPDDYSRFLYVYWILGTSNSVIVLIRSFLFAYGGIRAARTIHLHLLRAVVYTKVRFFEVTPAGRILNRFSTDTDTVDDSLPFDLNRLLADLVGVLGTLLTTIYGIPWLCLFVGPLIPIYHWLQNQYRMTSRELKRITSVSISPLYSHVGETMSGLSTIRAFKSSDKFVKENEENVNVLQKCDISALGAQSWLNIRLQLIGLTVVGGACILTALQKHLASAESAFVGLAISYALTLTSSLSSLLNDFVETERKMVSLERVNEYIEQCEPEVENSEDELVPIFLPFAWPGQGVISFQHVSLKYREDIPYSLRDVSFETLPGEKVGIVGRTGAGKSSLFSALLRVHDVNAGKIEIDGVNVKEVPLHKLRSEMTIIPQEPFIFNGTLRENMDPLNETDFINMHKVINLYNLAPLITKIGGLGAMIEDGGSNLSAGEKQLLCLIRAVLRNSKVICMDEATANVDMETEKRIQEVTKTAFKYSTVLIIAHRIQSVLDCDRILVMGDGRVLEFDTPAMLMADSNSHFYQLINQQNM